MLDYYTIYNIKDNRQTDLLEIVVMFWDSDICLRLSTRSYIIITMNKIKDNRQTNLLETRQWLCLETKNMSETEYQRLDCYTNIYNIKDNKQTDLLET